jgi:hypothetical protein
MSESWEETHFLARSCLFYFASGKHAEKVFGILWLRQLLGCFDFLLIVKRCMLDQSFSLLGKDYFLKKLDLRIEKAVKRNFNDSGFSRRF